MRVLVSGGAGYIGSVVAAHLLVGGHDVTVLDDLSTGHEDAVPNGAAFIRGTVSDKAPGVLAERGIEAVLHFAASSLVGESVANPAKYWANNLGGRWHCWTPCAERAPVGSSSHPPQRSTAIPSAPRSRRPT